MPLGKDPPLWDVVDGELKEVEDDEGLKFAPLDVSP